MRHEAGLGNATWGELEAGHDAREVPQPTEREAPYTGLFLAEEQSVVATDGAGAAFLYAEEAAFDVFRGTITEIHADADFVLASKTGALAGGAGGDPGAYAAAMIARAEATPSANVYLAEGGGELLVFTVQDGEESFGIPYLLRGRIELPYPDVFGLTRRDNLALVANGHGGVQVVDLSRLDAPYRVGFIKPNGFARDVAVAGDFAFIAASQEGLVVADLTEPSMPIVAVVDTMGIANRVDVEGSRVFVTDMAGDGRASAVVVFDVRDPYRPRVERVVELLPSRPDLVEDGAYDVAVAGGRAYVTVLASNQEDRPAQSLLEIVDLALAENPARDATIPAVVHREPTEDDFAARGITIVRGGIHVSAGRRGLARVELPAMTILSHTPASADDAVSTLLDRIVVELSAALDDDTDLSRWFAVNELDPTLGEDVTAELFDLRFRELDGVPDRRFVELVRREGAELEPRMQYFVSVRAGLVGGTVQPLPADYVFEFSTSRARGSERPRIVTVTPSVGSTGGGTSVEICGEAFGAGVSLSIGQQRHVVTSFVAAGSSGPGEPEFDCITTTTLPNYAGPAAVEVTTASSLRASRIGGYVYVDDLVISFLDPAIVRVDQVGAGETVRVVGNGFHRGVVLRAWPQGDPSRAVEVAVGPSLRVLRAEEMHWTVPDFGAAHRGFVDVEVRDPAEGSRHLRPNALFYGRLTTARSIEVAAEVPPPPQPGVTPPPPDANELPPGLIRDIAVDSERRLVYVLGSATASPELSARSDRLLRGWLSLVRYHPDRLGDAAPMHGLGYYNTPLDLAPRAITLGPRHVYVTADSVDVTDRTLEHEGRRWLLVYERELSVPSEGEPTSGGENRQFVHALPLPFATAPEELEVAGDLLFVSQSKEGLAVISLQDPARPSVVRTLTTVEVDGYPLPLRPTSVDVIGTHLHVGRARQWWHEPDHLVFDVAHPGMPLVSSDVGPGGRRAVLAGGAMIGVSDSVLALSLREMRPPARGRELGAFDPRGFELDQASFTTSLSGLTGIAAIVGLPTPLVEPGHSYLSIFDSSRPTEITLLDAMRIPAEYAGAPELRGADLVRGAEMSSDGIVVAHTDNRILAVDTLVQDVAWTRPRAEELGVPPEEPIEIRFTRDISPADLAVLLSYVDLVEVDGSSDGRAVPFDGSLGADARTVRIVPVEGELRAGTRHELRFAAELGSRRTQGLFDSTVRFETATGSGARPELVSLEPTVVSTAGGRLTIRALDTGATPAFTLGGLPATIEQADEEADGVRRFVIVAPPNVVGPASLRITRATQARSERLGAVRYLPPLRLDSVTPPRGSLNGGTVVTVRGEGFSGGRGDIEVWFGDTPVAEEHLRVLDGSTIEVVTPSGQLGTVDVSVRTREGGEAVLPDAFEYQQPLQARIGTSLDRIYEIALDPTGTFLVAAAGESGVLVYNVDPTAVPDATEAELRDVIDRDGDRIDDRIVAWIPVPGRVLGIDTYFERGADRVVATGVAGGSGVVWTITFDPLDPSRATVTDTLPLFSEFARGVDVENERALVAMAERGLGVVDIQLPGESYLAARVGLPSGHSALDAARLATGPGVPEIYAVATGRWDIEQNALVDEVDPRTGALYLVERGSGSGFRVLSSVPVPAQRIAVSDHLLYLAAGRNGVVVVDVSDPGAPRIVRRIDDAGVVYDVAVHGAMLYAATGTTGIVTWDVSDPARPVRIGGRESSGADVRAVTSSGYSGIGAGSGPSASGWWTVQVSPDVALNVVRVDPASRIVDRDGAGRERIVLRFNKAIDLHPPNLALVQLQRADGTPAPADLEIVNNDAIFTLRTGHGLSVGAELVAIARAGIASVKPVTPDQTIVLHRLLGERRFSFVYRGAQVDRLQLDSVVPRRIPRGRRERVTVSALGVPTDPARVRLWVGEQPATIVRIDTSSDDGRAVIITADIAPIHASGPHDVVLEAERAGLWETATLRGGIVVDAPILFDRVTPRWGPRQGGTTVTIHGDGFEPGTTVGEGLTIRIGDVPVRSIRVLSHDRIEIVTPGGRVGPNAVRGSDRYGNATELAPEHGFGYGLRQLATQPLPFAPREVIVDPVQGIAVTNGGSLQELHARFALRPMGGGWSSIAGYVIPDVVRIASVDVSDPVRPLLVGGSSMIRENGAALEARVAALDRLGADSIAIAQAFEQEEGVTRRRFYVAGGADGASRVNGDDLNGLQWISGELAGATITDVTRAGDLLLAASASAPTPISDCRLDPCTTCPAEYRGSRIEAVSFADPFDPVPLGVIDTELAGANTLVADGRWVYAGGVAAGYLWGAFGACELYPPSSWRSAEGVSGGAPALGARDLFDPALRRDYLFEGGNIHDVVPYGDHLIVALGAGGLAIVERDRPEAVTVLAIDHELQPNSGSAVRLRRFGNLVFVSAAGGGVIVVDVAEPEAPTVVSAGNSEPVHGLDQFRGGLVAVTPSGGIGTFDLPGAIVRSTSVDEDGWIASDEAYEITFGEAVTVSSIVDDGAILVRRTDTGAAVEHAVVPVAPEGGAAQRFVVEFEREAGVEYSIEVLDARTLRSTGLWRPFLGHVRAAHQDAVRPRVERLEHAVQSHGAGQSIVIHGDGFRASPELHVFVDGVEMAYSREPDGRALRLAPSTIDLFDTGLHHLRVVDHELEHAIPGALVIGSNPLSVRLRLEVESGPVEGGIIVPITADQDAILPGARVVMRARRTGEVLRTERTDEGTFIRNLREDVRSLRSMVFTLPGVVEPDVYDVYLLQSGIETRVGAISYSLGEGRGISLPNYPPMSIGAAQVRGELLYVGVKDGAPPNGTNRFLMTSGLEIYDISIWDRPVRLSQLPMPQPVTGLEVDDGLAYLASGADGLVVVAVHDPTDPQRLASWPVPGTTATDVALQRGTGVLAMSIADGLGTGLVRFFDTRDPALQQPPTHPQISFTEGELAGQPHDVAWLGDRLYVLFRGIDGHPRIAIFSSFGSAPDVRVVEVPSGYQVASLDLGSLSLSVQHGQIVVTTDVRAGVGLRRQRIIVLREHEDGTVEEEYWRETEYAGATADSEIVEYDGVVFIAEPDGIRQQRVPGFGLAGSAPAWGSELGPGDRIALRFNQLLQTDEESVRAALSFTAADGSAVPFTLDAINTLSGGLVMLELGGSLSAGTATLEVGTGIRRLDGQPLDRRVRIPFRLVSTRRPSIARVVRDGGTAPYFHADGTEIAVIEGEGFGTSASELQIVVGGTPISSSEVSSVADDRIRFRLSALAPPISPAALELRVLRGDAEARLAGAIIVQPALVLQDVYPTVGPPEGGNLVDLYGVGFNSRVTVTFGGAPAADLRVLSAGHLRVRAPSGAFGPADVAVTSTLFADEASVLPGAYFYAERETGSVDVAEEGHAVRAVVAREQYLYAITGGHYDAIDRRGSVLQRLESSTGQLIVADISDPVRPRIVPKTEGDVELPRHLSIPLPPDGFRDLALTDDDLFIVGGNRLFHLDVTLPAAPLVLAQETLVDAGGAPDSARSVLAAHGLVFVAADAGVRVLQVDGGRRLRALARVPASALGGVPGRMAIRGGRLWVTVPEASRLVALALDDGSFEIRNTIEVRDRRSELQTPSHLLFHDDLVLVSTGASGRILAFQLREGGLSAPLGELALSLLRPDVDLDAGQMLLVGQTLYVAAGDGDVQLFDLGRWLDLDFSIAPPLVTYYGVTGAVRGIALGRGSIYAGTVFLRGGPGGGHDENPVVCPDDRACHHGLGGSIDTLTDRRLSIVETVPAPRGRLGHEAPVELQFNRILDPILFDDPAVAASLFAVSVGGAPVATFVSARANVAGTRVSIRPRTAWDLGLEHAVTVSAAVSDLAGATLGTDFAFRFMPTDRVEPVVERAEPSSGTWRGGDPVRVFGAGFGPESVVRFGDVEATVVSAMPSVIEVVTPRFESAAEQDKVVEVSVTNGDRETRAPATFTFVADPAITAVGRWDSVGRRLTNETRLRFDGGELVGVRGTGLRADTELRVNGRVVADAIVMDESTLVFRAPDRTIGRIRIEARNGTGPEASDERMEIVLHDDWQLSSCSVLARDGQLLALARGRDVGLYATFDRAAPRLLSTVRLDANAIAIDLAGGTLGAILEGSNELVFFDLSDVYAPRLLSQIRNPGDVRHQALDVHGDRFVTRSPEGAHVGTVTGATWLDIGPAQSVALDERFIYRLTRSGTAGTVEVHDLDAPETSIAGRALAIPSPTALEAQPGRLIVVSATHDAVAVEVLDPAPLLDPTPSLGSFGARSFAQGVDASAVGELLAIARRDASVQLYDLGGEGRVTGTLDVRRVAELRTQSGLQRVRFERDWLTWGTVWNCGSVQVPLAHAVAVSPETDLAAPREVLRVEVAGDHEAWSTVGVAVEQVRTGTVLSGVSIGIAGALEWTPSDAFAADESYRVSLSRAPVTTIDGGALTHDLSFAVASAPVFGAARFALHAVTPAVVVVGQPTELVVRGADLASATEVRLGDLEVSDLASRSGGSELVVTATAPRGGPLTLSARAGDVWRHLPAAVLATAPLAIESVVTDHPSASDVVGDAGGTAVVIRGSGFDVPVDVHVLRFAEGEVPSAANRLSIVEPLEGLTGVRFASAPCVSGTRYDVVVRRPATGDSVVAAGALACLDDTGPRLVSETPMAVGRSWTLRFSEPIVPGTLVATATTLDYSPPTDVDVTGIFDTLVASNEITVRLRGGETLTANRRYRLVLTGIEDAAGNPANAGVPIETSFTSPDTLQPQLLEIRLSETSEPLGPGGRDVLVSGLRYSLVISAIDNVTAERDLRHELRVARNGSATFESVPRHWAGELFELSVGELDTSLVLRHEVVDAAGNRAVRDVALDVSGPQLDVVSFGASPDPVEERGPVEIALRVEGPDVESIRSVSFRVLGRVLASTSSTETGPGSREYRVATTAPSLDELRAALGSAAEDLPSTALVAYGAAAEFTASTSYRVVRDATAPRVTITSPVDGAQVARGEPIEILYRAIDENSVAAVEMRTRLEAEPELGPPVAPSRPGVFVVEPSALEPLHVEISARDEAGNRGAASLVLRPFDPEAGPARLAIRAPLAGATLRERETVEVVAELGNVHAATLHLELRGDPADPANPEPIELRRAAGDPEIVSQSVRLPSIEASTALVLRLVHTPAAGAPMEVHRIVNLLDDDEVPERMEIEVAPTARVLGGTELWVRGEPPADMPDFEAGSLEVQDPPGTSGTRITLARPFVPVQLAPGDATVAVVGRLHDRSGNPPSVHTIELQRLPYVSGSTSVLHGAASPSHVLQHLVVLPAIGGERVAFVESSDEGWSLRDASSVLATGAGTLGPVHATGSAVVALEQVGGERHVVLWPLESGELGAPVRQPFAGDLVGASGDVVLTRHGDVIGGLVRVGDEFVPLAGIALPSEIVAVDVDGHRAFVLTAEGDLHVLQPDLRDVPQIAEVTRVPVGGAAGLRARGDVAYLWSVAPEVRAIRLPLDGSEAVELGLLALAPADAAVVVEDVAFDGEIVWVRASGSFVDGAPGASWHAFLDGEHVGVRSVGALEMAFGERTLYELRAGEGGSDHVDSTPLESAAHGDTSWSVDVSDVPEGRLVRITAAPGALGAETFRVHDGAGTPVTFWPRSDAAATAFVLPRALGSDPITLVRSDRAGRRDTRTIEGPDPSTSALWTEIAPREDGRVTAGVVAPVMVRLDASARVSRARVGAAPGEPAVLAPVGGGFGGWLALDGDDDVDLTFDLDEVRIAPWHVDVIPNVVPPGVLDVLQPPPLHEVVEGEPLLVELHAPAEANGPFRFAEVRLVDSAAREIASLRVASPVARASLRAPRVAVRENVSLHVRAHYGEDLHYLEAGAVPVLVFPRVAVPDPHLVGLGEEALVGAELALAIDNAPELLGRIELLDEQNEVILRGGRVLRTVVPDTRELTVVATLSDSVGTTSSVRTTIPVVGGLELRAAPAVSFDVGLSDVGGAWLASERGLDWRTSDGTRTERARFHTAVTALAHVAGHLAVGLDDGEVRLMRREGDGLVEVARTRYPHPIRALVGHESRLGVVPVTGLPREHAVSPVGLGAAEVSFSLANGAKQIVWYGGRFASIDADGTLHAPGPRIESSSFRALTVVDDVLYAVDDDGLALVRGTSSRRVPIALGARALIPMQGELLALDGDGQVVVLDVRDPWRPRARGTFVTGAVDPERVTRSGGTLLSPAGSLSVVRAGRPPALRAAPPARGQIARASASSGAFLAAASEYGGMRLLRGDVGPWTESVYPSPFAASTSDVAAWGTKRLFLQPDLQRVVLEVDGSTPWPLLSERPYRALAMSPTRIVASAGASLFVIDATSCCSVGSKPPASRIDVEVGAEIVGLAISGSTVWAATSTGRVHRVRLPDALPIDAYSDVRITPVFEGGVVRRIVAEGEHAFFALGSTLHRVGPSGAHEAVAFASPLTALASSPDRVWVATAADVHVISSSALSPVGPEPLLTTTQPVSALAPDRELLLTGHGTGGVQLHDLSRAVLASTSALASPVAGTTVTPGASLRFALASDEGVASVRYSIGDRVVEVRRHPPFAAVVAVPPGVLGAIAVRAEVETVWGETLTSDREIAILGEGDTANPQLLSSVALSLTERFVPVPMRATARADSRFPIARAEFYSCADETSADCSLLGQATEVTHRELSGPPWTFSLERNEPVGSRWYYARIVDVHGNAGVSERVSFERVADTVGPAMTATISGPRLVDGRPVADFPFSVRVTALERESGHSLLTLSDAAGVLAVAPESHEQVSTLELDFAPLPAGTHLELVATARDRAGNLETLPIVVDVVADQPPSLSFVEVGTQRTIIEGEPFGVRALLTDDLAGVRLEVVWQGQVTSSEPTGFRSELVSVRVPDVRARLTAEVVEPIVLRAIDVGGSVTTWSADVRVLPDSPPNGAAVRIEAPIAGFYGEAFSVHVDAREADDVRAPAYDTQHPEIQLIDLSSGTAVPRERRAGPITSYAFDVPSDSPLSEIRFFARVFDTKGQAADTPEYVVPLRGRPNQIAFADPGDGAPVNPTRVLPTTAAPLAVVVRDTSARPIPGQEIIVRQSWGGAYARTTGDDGFARFSVSPPHAVGSYDVSAEVAGISTTHAFEVVAGEVSRIELAVAPARAGEQFAITLRPIDVGGNEAAPSEPYLVFLDLPGMEVQDHPQFVRASESRGTLALTGTAVIDVVAPTTAGSRQARVVPLGAPLVSVHFDDDGDPTTPAIPPCAGYFGCPTFFHHTTDHDDDPTTPPALTYVRPFRVGSADPAELRLFASPASVEVGQVSTVHATVLDAHENVVDELPDGTPTTFEADFSVSGGALLRASGTPSGGAPALTISLARGRGSVLVTDATAETVTVRTEALRTAPDGVTLGTVDVEFRPTPPRIASRQWLRARDGDRTPLEITLDQPVRIREGYERYAVRVFVGGPGSGSELVPGSATIDGTGTRLRFLPDARVPWGTCASAALTEGVVSLVGDIPASPQFTDCMMAPELYVHREAISTPVGEDLAGTTEGASSSRASDCAWDGPDRVHPFVPSQSGIYRVRATHPARYSTLVIYRADEDASVACRRAWGSVESELYLEAGVAYELVHDNGLDPTGAYTLRIDLVDDFGVS